MGGGDTGSSRVIAWLARGRADVAFPGVGNNCIAENEVFIATTAKEQLSRSVCSDYQVAAKFIAYIFDCAPSRQGDVLVPSSVPVHPTSPPRGSTTDVLNTKDHTPHGRGAYPGGSRTCGRNIHSQNSEK